MCPSRSTPFDADDGVTLLQEKVLDLLEMAGIPTETNDKIMEMISAAEQALESGLPEGSEPPSYDDPGRILVRYWGELGGPYQKYECEVFDYDSNSSVFYIQEGIGFDYWLDQHAEFTEPGHYVIEGITGHYSRGDYYEGWDANETWEFTSMRPATAEEISSGALSEIAEGKEP
jgi:hypothetical protein